MPGTDAANIEDLRRRARRNLPRMFFDYIDGGAFGEITLQRNLEDFNRWTLEQQVLVDISKRDLSTTFLGRRYPLPFLLGPIGFAGMFWPKGEVEAAAAAAAAGIPMTLSTFSISSAEEVAAELPAGDLAFQLYVLRDRALAADLLARAETLGCRTLVLTVDNDISSVRERDTRNGFRTATRLSWRTMLDMARHPAWCLRMAPEGRPGLGNVRHRPDLAVGLMAQAMLLSANVDPALSWRDLDWLRDHWHGRVVLKGILSAADAERARSAGVDGIVVSSHGGRQLDGVRSSIAVLPEIADRLAGSIEILFDSGIRRGSDIVKALALGADAVMLGRAWAYGLAAGGRGGVARAIELLRAEFEITMALAGFRSVDELRRGATEALRALDDAPSRRALGRADGHDYRPDLALPAAKKPILLGGGNKT